MSNNLPAVRYAVGDIAEMAKSVSRSRLFGLDEAQAFTLMLLAESKGHNLSLAEKFLRKIRVVESGCWIWTGCKTPDKYGYFYMGDRTAAGNRRPATAHRASYRLFVGTIPASLEIDHLCRVPLCVHPFHLEAVSHHTNLMRGNGMSARYASQSHCKRGHLKCPENIYYYNGKPHGCIPCQAIHDKAKAERRRQARRQEQRP